MSGDVRTEPTRIEVELAQEVDQEIVDLGSIPMTEQQRFILRSTVVLALSKYRRMLAEKK